jgi:hypothetical protein
MRAARVPGPFRSHGLVDDTTKPIERSIGL